MIFFRRIILVFVVTVFAGCALQKTPADVAPLPALSPLPAIAGPEEGFGLAMEAYKAGDMETAFLIAQQVAEQYPNTPWQKRSLFLSGRALIALDRASDAEAVMSRIPSEYPELADYAVYFLAEYHFSKARYAEAVKLYQRVMERYPKSFWVIRSALRKAQALLESGSYPQAAEAFEKFLRDNPRSDFCPDGGLGLGKALAADGKQEQAVRAYRDVSIKYPGSPPDLEAEKALVDLKLSGAEIPELTADERYEQAKNLFKTSQYDKAAAAFTRLLEDEPALPQKADVLLRTGVSLLYLGRRAEAIQTLERMVREHPAEQRGAEALNWIGRAYSRIGDRDRAVNAFLKIVSAYPGSEWADDALYLIGNIYRESNDIRNALKFYDQLAKKFPESAFADSAIWWKAWAYYTAGDFKKTDQTLQELIARYPKSFLVNQARYWQGRAAEKAGDKSRAAAYYRKVLARGPYTYYGYRSAERLANIEVSALPVKADAVPGGNSVGEEGFSADDTQELADTDGPPVWTEEAMQVLSANPSFKKTIELMHLNMKKEAAAELWSLQEKIPKKHGALLGLSKAFFELGDYYRSLILVLRNYERYLDGPAGKTPEDFWFLAYPQGYWDRILSYSRKYNQDPYFIAAIIREESHFHPEAVSPAGARGVMQVMPSTGEWVAQMLRMPGFDRGKLFDSDTSISIGTWYIGHLMKRLKGDLLLVAAAYNAGPEAVFSWLGKNANGMERDEFAESIPFSETRGYVKKVLRNYFEYKRVYGKAGLTAAPVPLRSGETTGSVIKEEEAKTP